MKYFKCVNNGRIETADTIHEGTGLIEGEIYESDGKIVYDNANNPCYYINNVGLKLVVRFVEYNVLCEMKLFLVYRPSFIGTLIPVFNYTLALNKTEAIQKVRLKWGEFDSDIVAFELSESELKELVISTNSIG